MLKVYIAGTDYTQEMSSFTTDTVDAEISVGQTIDIGLYKDLSEVWVELLTNTGARSFTVKAWNGSAFAAISVVNNTRNLTRSGSIVFGRQAKLATLHGQSLYWYRIELVSASAAPLELAIDGIGVVFSDDADLKEEVPDVADLLPEGKTSFINFHQAARKDIVTAMRNSGKVKVLDGARKNLTEFDFLDIDEVSEASKFLVLSKIYAWRSDAVDDKFFQKAEDFKSKYTDKMSLYFVSLDLNDDGIQDEDEVLDINSMPLLRL